MTIRNILIGLVILVVFVVGGYYLYTHPSDNAGNDDAIDCVMPNPYVLDIGMSQMIQCPSGYLMTKRTDGKSVTLTCVAKTTLKKAPAKKAEASTPTSEPTPEPKKFVRDADVPAYHSHKTQ